VIADDFDFEPIPGLPGHLPPGEHLLWQGAPRWQTVARTVYHVRRVALYFAILMAFGVGMVLWEGHGALSAVRPLLLLAPMAFVATGILTLMSWLTERTTVYSITNRRVVMRFGIALPITLNLPFSRIGGAALKLQADGSGDIPLDLATNDRVAYLVLWPHARPWRVAKPEPMLRCIPRGAEIAKILASAMSSARTASIQAQNGHDAVTQPIVQDSTVPIIGQKPRMMVAS
jgi:Bacterial PH domain